MKKTNIALIGFMGSGKTTIGRLLAKQTGKKLVDIDRLIVKRAGMPVRRIFEKQGEDGFRTLETKVTISVAKKSNQVISTGGGVVKRERNINALRKTGIVVYLKTSFNEIVDRIRMRDDRPLFDMDNIKGTKKLYTSRLPVYKAAADLTVVTDNKDAEHVCAAIIKGLNRRMDWKQ
ncbi:MAG: shikimate kinase [Spirochaetia bacterium]|nr:shikimate kinase [Spirochaetia bacterium]